MGENKELKTFKANSIKRNQDMNDHIQTLTKKIGERSILPEVGARKILKSIDDAAGTILYPGTNLPPINITNSITTKVFIDKDEQEPKGRVSCRTEIEKTNGEEGKDDDENQSGRRKEREEAKLKTGVAEQSNKQPFKLKESGGDHENEGVDHILNAVLEHSEETSLTQIAEEVAKRTEQVYHNLKLETVRNKIWLEDLVWEKLCKKIEEEERKCNQLK